MKADTLRETAVEKGLQIGLPPPKAHLLADTIIGDLVGRKG